MEEREIESPVLLYMEDIYRKGTNIMETRGRKRE